MRRVIKVVAIIMGVKVEAIKIGVKMDAIKVDAITVGGKSGCKNNGG